MKLLLIDAFTQQPFAGNPAAVCFTEQEQDPVWMQQLAAELKQSETAFIRPLDDGFALRWFTPKIEVDLCGHATLASAHALWSEGAVSPGQSIRFHTNSGVLTCKAADGMIELDFPSTPPTETIAPDGLLEALGVQPTYMGQTRFDKLIVVDTEQAVRSLKPDFARLVQVRTRGVMVTSASEDPRFEFVSRFFAPAAGIDEDPVTGSAHCCLGPYWGQQLGKTEMTAYQASQRGGTVHVRLAGDRVILGGRAVTLFRGDLA